MDTKDTEAPIIRKPTDPTHIAKLEAKLAEYKQRYNAFHERHPHWPPFHPVIHDCHYKIELLSKVLQDGQINTHETCLALAEKEGETFDVKSFINCAGVIDDYCQTGGTHIRGGTGLRAMTPTSHDPNADPTSP